MTVSISEQSVEELGGPDSILVRQRRDHADIDTLMTACLSDAPDSAPSREAWKSLVQLVFTHAFAEETVLWPVLRRLAPDGEKLTERVEQEHQAINDLVARIEKAGDADPRRRAWMQRACALIRQDIRDEEDLLLPRLRDGLDTRRLREIGAAWEGVRRTAPTHPHPAVPRRPPGNALLGIPLSPFDRLRDASSGSTGEPAYRRLVPPALGAAALALGVAGRTWRRGRSGGGPDRHGKRKTGAAVQVAVGQGVFNLVGGLWPLVHRRSFEWVFGSKTDEWLQMTTGGLLTSAGVAQLLAARNPEDTAQARVTGTGTALTLLAIDLLYVPKGRISPTYLLDAALEAGWLAAWRRAAGPRARAGT
ncbi:hemerythrin domain-containing protein [Actinacidiphila sp. DG2A-62]|uniref:hemerythrin domain-containing protein n=1 Tax=Actinacidiphila sp. DG2A-62 TaxID=3108821 RepID=UPI002DB82022|nr:hemerythrin domain-containing protein [Actinacidiphila sp. DG2A-62]MEC3992743.1 hemerythrin domain-containing protein [Actinacidiphila sp. DG2A-62]